MNDKPSPPQEDAVPRKMTLLGQKTASERAVRTLRKNWTMPGAAPTLSVAPPTEPPVAPQTREAQADTRDEPVEQAIETLDPSSASDKKNKKDKKKKSKKKKNKDKKSKGKKVAK